MTWLREFPNKSTKKNGGKEQTDMSMKTLVEAAQARAGDDVVSREVDLGIDYLGSGSQVGVVQATIRKMDNDQKAQFVLALIQTLSDMRHYELAKKEAARSELVELFGEEILKHPAVLSKDGFFFTLTADGRQFRGWYAPFGSVSRGHFDSCGSGCFFSAGCQHSKTLESWLLPIVGGRIMWSSNYGKLWMSHGRSY
jgi:hypothetical protein